MSFISSTIRTILCLLAALSGLSLFAAGSVEIDGRKILVDGQPFTFRGVCYQPTPIGENAAEEAPYGDYFTDVYDDLYERDIVQMRAMGANVARTYGWDLEADHDKFLDTLYNDGRQPIRILINLWIDPETDWSDDASVEAITTDYLKIAEGVKGHPAVLGFLVGNETNGHHGNGSKASFWKAMNRVAKALKEHSPERLVSVAITDALDKVSQFDSLMTDIDFWSIQVYRGLTFGNFYDEYAAVSSKPLVVTEFGLDAYDGNAQAPYRNNAKFVADTVGAMVVEMNKQQAICSGGCVFEFGDEWWKSKGSPFTHDSGGLDNPGYPDKILNEEWWGIFEVLPNGSEKDDIRPRELFYRLQSLWARSN